MVSYPFGLILYYVWSVATLVILLNVLVALFSSSCASSSPSLALAFLSRTLSRASPHGLYSS